MLENADKNAQRILRVFVSSVGKVMGEERDTLRDLIWKGGHFPIAMEGFFGNHTQTSLDVVISNLKKADIIVIVLGFTYGAVIGKNMKCVDCPIFTTCTGKKSIRQKKCSISYTHFEYLFAKQEKIRSYCIIQKDVGNVEGFQDRLKNFDYKEEERKKLINEYSDQRTMQLNLIEDAQSNWSMFYDANDSMKKIPERFKEIFAGIVSDISNNGSELYGLVDGRVMLEQLREQNRRYEALRKELDETNAFYRRLSSLTNPVTAVTGTCIPFEYIEENDTIITYLILNSAYEDGNRLMFPGGHAFVNDESPEDIAIAKARIEAGLVVRPIDLYQNFDMLPYGKPSSGKDSQFNAEFSVYKPPHYSYLFVQNENAKCYRDKNHHYHYDAVYVCEITDILSEEKCAQKRVKIELPNKVPTMVATKNYLDTCLRNVRYLSDSYGDYIIKMLYEAYKDYVTYLNNMRKAEGKP